MAVLEKIRVKFGILITVLVALALLSFIIDPQTLQSAAQMFSSDNKVGEMNGKTISYKDYYEKVDYYTNLFELLGQKVSDEQGQAQVREFAWESLLNDNVIIPAIKKAGVFVGDQEMLDMAQGDHISPILAQQQLFLDENGQFSQANVKNFVSNMDQDPSGQSAAYWNFLEKNMQNQRLFEKYNNLLQNLSFQSNLEKNRVMADNNVTYDVDYIMLPVGFDADSTITVTDKEVRKYYDNRKEMFKQQANRDIEYVMFEVVPSAEDIAAARNDFDSLYAQFKVCDNARDFATTYSDAKFDAMYYTKNQIVETPEFASAFSAKVSDVHVGDNRFEAISVIDRARRSDTVRISFVAVPFNDDKGADSLLNIVKKSGPTAEFREPIVLTEEIAAANNLSELGELFNEGVKTAKIRSIASQCILVCYVNERSKAVEKYQIAKLAKNVNASEETFCDYRNKAVALAEKADGKIEKFNEAVAADNLLATPVNNITEATRRIGVCENARELVRWVFDKKTGKNDVSDVITIDTKYHFIVAVTETRKEGYADVNEVAPQIRNVLSVEKKVEKLKGEVAAKIQGKTDINDIAATLETTVSHQPGVSYGSQYQQYDNAFLGALANSQTGKVYGPIKGQMGVIVFSVANRTEGSFFTEEDAKTYHMQKASYGTQMGFSIMTEAADVKDYRARFF